LSYADRPHSATRKESGRQFLVLLAEDTDQVRSFCARCLIRAGFQVLESPNGFSALKKFNEFSEEVSLLIADVNMPIMDGLELTAEARKLRPDLPILLISSYSDRVEEIESRLDECTKFLAKPFEIADLIDRVNALTGAGKQLTN
jgi:two-component system, cell cycle sensor histidine kinase and response regulator CckA